MYYLLQHIMCICDYTHTAVVAFPTNIEKNTLAIFGVVCTMCLRYYKQYEFLLVMV